jgi:hypothetical protein
MTFFGFVKLLPGPKQRFPLPNYLGELKKKYCAVISFMVILNFPIKTSDILRETKRDMFS